MPFLTLQDILLENKRVMIREDFNVPLDNDGRITSDARLLAALPTIQFAQKKGAKIILLSHLGRPTEGKFDAALSLAPVAKRLSELLQHPVRLEKNWLNNDALLEKNDIVLCENVRFNNGEKKDDEQLARRMASLCDVFVMDAFATAHRKEASTHGIIHYAPVAVAGPLLLKELQALDVAFSAPARPMVAIVGGSKVSTKLQVLESLLQKVDVLITGGGIANTFLAAAGYNIGKSLYEPDLLPEAKRLMQAAKAHGVVLYLPEDVIVAENCSAEAASHMLDIKTVGLADRILDVGLKTSENYREVLKKAKTILWNGPLGVFEIPAFSGGTRALALAIAESSAFSLAGGGDTLAAIAQYGVENAISYISTGGGAFLEFIEGKTLPAVAALEARYAAS